MPCSTVRAGAPRLRRGLAAAAVSVGLIAAPAPAPAATNSASVPALGARPYVRLFTEVKDCAAVLAANNLTGAALDAHLAELTRWYVHFNAQGGNRFTLGDGCQGRSPTTLASKLAAKGAWVSNYRNGSSTNQASLDAPINFDEAALLEAADPLSIGTFWAGDAAPNKKGGGGDAARLAAPMDGDDTVVRITSAAGVRPPGAAATWPFVASRGTGTRPGAHSANTRDFVSWIRLDDEIMQISAPPTASGGEVRLTVQRGLWGTRRSSHPSGTRAMSPVYIGSVGAGNADAGLAGTPQVNRTDLPLRYSLKIWQPGASGFIADRVRATLGPDLQGHNGLWLDLTSCVIYNQADAGGSPVWPWDDPTGAKMTPDRWGAHQQTKLSVLHQTFAGVRLIANNLGGNYSPCNESILATVPGGGVLEHWMKAEATNPTRWEQAMAAHHKAQASQWPALHWVRWSRDFDGDVARYKRFSYGSLLLGLRPGSTAYQYGGNFDLKRPDDLYFWDLGAPARTVTSTAQTKVADSALHRRDFSRGMVLVNPSGQTETFRLDRAYFDVSAGGVPRLVTSVTVRPGDAALLVRPL